MADALHHSVYLQEWYSPYKEDVFFGGKHDFFEQKLEGKNCYINPPFNTFMGNQNLIEKVIQKMADTLRSNLPTRAILLLPIFEGKVGHLYEEQARNSRFMEICNFSRGSFSFVAPEHYHVHNNFQPGYFAEKVGLYLCANKASLQRDPINWETLKSDLLQWAQQNTRYPITLSTLTDQKFSQRITPTHSARSFNTDRNYVFKSSNNFFHYYDFSFPPGDETQSMKTHVPEPTHLELLSRINHHDRLAGTLGILPNHLIKLLKLTNQEDLTKIIDDLRFTTFWTTYSIWTKRRTLNREFWQNIPECCKLENKHKTLLDKKNPTGKKRRRLAKIPFIIYS